MEEKKKIISKEYYNSLPFQFNSIAWHEVPFDKCLMVDKAGELMNDHLVLSDYGKGLKKIYFIPIIKLPGSRLHPTKYRMYHQKKEFEAGVRMDYDVVMKADTKCFKLMVGALFLNTLDILKKRKPKDFDVDALKKDVECLLIREGYLVPKPSGNGSD